MIDINETLDSYRKAITYYIEEIELENTTSSLEHLELLSYTLSSINLINSIVDFRLLNIRSLYLKDTVHFKILDFNQALDTENLEVSINIKDKECYKNILHSFGEALYFDILNLNSNSLNRQVEEFSEKALTIFLNRDNEFLDTCVSNPNNTGNLLRYLTKGNQLFSRALESFLLFSKISSYSPTSDIDFTNEEYLLFKDDLNGLLESYNKYKNSPNELVSRIVISKEDKINIIINEERLKQKYSYFLENKKTQNINALENAVKLYDFNICSYNDELDFHFKINEKDDFTDIDIKNYTYYKDLLKDFDSKSICDIASFLEEDLVMLREEVSFLQGEVNSFKSSLLSDKRAKKNRPLEELLLYLFFISQELKIKTQMKKSLESAEITYADEHIEYSKFYAKNKDVIQFIHGEPFSIKVDISKLKSKILKLYGLNLTPSEEGLLFTNISNSPLTIKLTKNEKLSLKKRAKEQRQNTNNIKVLESSKIIDSLLKQKLHSIYTNPSSKFKTRAYKSLEINKELKDYTTTNSKLDTALDKLLNDVEIKEKEKDENTGLGL